MPHKNLDSLTEKIMGCAISVHRNLGPGFLESVYQAALAFEMGQNNIPFKKKKRYLFNIRI